MGIRVTYASGITADGVVTAEMDTPVIFRRGAKHAILEGVDVFGVGDEVVSVVCGCHGGCVFVYVAAEAAGVGAKAICLRIWGDVVDN